jgi:hypothetical protein
MMPCLRVGICSLLMAALEAEVAHMLARTDGRLQLDDVVMNIEASFLEMVRVSVGAGVALPAFVSSLPLSNPVMLDAVVRDCVCLMGASQGASPALKSLGAALSCIQNSKTLWDGFVKDIVLVTLQLKPDMKGVSEVPLKAKPVTGVARPGLPATTLPPLQTPDLGCCAFIVEAMQVASRCPCRPIAGLPLKPDRCA